MAEVVVNLPPPRGNVDLDYAQQVNPVAGKDIVLAEMRGESFLPLSLYIRREQTIVIVFRA